MLSRFFIDRPIFATVLSVVITLTGVLALGVLPVAQYPRVTPPSVQVSINYPGASARVVADTVAAPIEQQVTGIPGMLYMSSQMSNDGSYMLTVTFDIDVDLNTALVMVQNRVAYAMPLLPTPVQNQGIVIRKKTPDMLCMINFVSAVEVTLADGKVIRGFVARDVDDEDEIRLKTTDGVDQRLSRKTIASQKLVYDDVFMSNYALINIKDEVGRVDGVSDVSIMGERAYSIRVWLDPQKLASRNLTAGDVAAAIRAQNLQAAAGRIASPPMGRGLLGELPIDTLGRLADPEQFGNIIVKVGAADAAGPALMAVRRDELGSAGPTIADLAPALVPGGTSVGGANLSGGAHSPGGAGAVDVAALIGSTSLLRARKATTERPLVSAAPKKKGPAAAYTLPATSIVRLKDVARVELAAHNYNISVTFDGAPSVGLSVYQLPGTNALDVANRVHARMRLLKKRFPDGLDYRIAHDTTPFIRESIWEVVYTLRDAVILVALVVLFFLQDWRAMILPMIDVPVALVGTLAVMAVMGYSLNNVSLFGLVLAIGIVVDDSIVVLENVERQLSRGLDVRTATLRAMREITGPILAITLVLCAVFIPCAFISGVTGRFFRQFALTIAASTVISAVNALTMTPSRAMLIFQSRRLLLSGTGAARTGKEALPWWSLGLAGWLTMTWGPMVWTAAGADLARPDHDAEQAFGAFGAILGSSLVVDFCFFAPGMLSGLAFGWFCIGPINRVLAAGFRAFNLVFDRATAMYGWMAAKTLRLGAVLLIAYGGLVLLTYAVFQDAPRGFVPQQDMGRIMVSIQLPDSATVDRTHEQLVLCDRVMRRIPGVRSTIGLSGISFVESAAGPNFGSFFVILDRFDRRQSADLRADAIMRKMREAFAAEILDARVVVAPSSPVPGISTSGGFKLMVQDRGSLGLRSLQDQSDTFIRQIREQMGEDIPKDVEDPSARPMFMLANVNTQFRSSTPQLFLEIDRTKAESVGLDFSDVNQTLQIYLGSLNVNRFNAFGRSWQVNLQADREFRDSPDDISQLQVRNRAGRMVPLGTLIRVREQTGPVFVRRYNQHTAAPIGGALMSGVSSGEVIRAVDDIADETLPRSMKAEWTELMYLQIREGNTTGIVFSLSVVFVFLALAALYESWTLPLAVILVVPLSMLFSILAVLIRKNVLGQDASVDIFVQIGFVVLVGLACKNSILIVEFAKELHQSGRSVFDATCEASRLRLRPILMTSLAFILGVVPLCFASGAGAEMRRSLGTAVFSGMLGVTVFGIFLTPAFFYVIQGIGSTRLFSGAAVQWAVSFLVGAALGGAIAYSLARLGVIHGMPRVAMVTLGSVLGVLVVAAARGLHNKWTAKGANE